MCTKPIRIINREKYLNKGYGQPYYIWINCGKCQECLQQKQTEWTLRTYYQLLECLNAGGWAYFDTLTYSPKHLPRLKKLTTIVEDRFNYPCFDYRDIRNFYETLRSYYKGQDRQIKYFITSEFGELRGRNHYHIILFVYNKDITPIELSRNVAKAWGKGRTDGQPWKSKKYVLQHNVINSLNLDAVRYVAKYVTKPQKWIDKINENWRKIEHFYKERKGYDKIQIKKLKKEYYRYSQPFHRQSQGYGIEALKYQTDKNIMEDGVLKYKDDSLSIMKYCALPNYFKRKLFEEQIKVNGKRIWILNEQGQAWKKSREAIIKEKLIDRLRDLDINRDYSSIIEDLAEYILFERGRTSGRTDYQKHLESTIAFNYNTDKDLIYLGKKIISKTYAGNDTIGYCTTNIEPTEWETNVYIRTDYENIINNLMVEQDTHSLALLKEHMREIKKFYFK